MVRREGIRRTINFMIFFLWVLVATIPAFLAAYFVPFGHPDNKEQKELENAEQE